jgi:hypothetical protein
MSLLCRLQMTTRGFEGPWECAVLAVSMSKKEFDRLEVLRAAYLHPVLASQSGRTQ